MSSVSCNFENIYQINAAYVEDMFARFKSNPGSVSAEWRAYFSGFFDGVKICDAQNSEISNRLVFEFSVAKLVHDYKSFGHLKAKINPLFQQNIESTNGCASNEKSHIHSEFFDLAKYGLNAHDLNRTTHAGILIGINVPTILHELIKQLEIIFCDTIGLEIEHIHCHLERSWLYEEFINLKRQILTLETQKKIFTELARSDALEKTIATKYVGKKRFSIEGSDAQIVAAESYIDELASFGTAEFRIAIAHRGRLNFLVNLIGKPLENLFAEFEGEPADDYIGDGDVKYHNGYEAIKKTRCGYQVRVGLSYNPSHLEFVDPVVMGETRAVQSVYHNSDTSKVATLVFHGDAAIAGQGVVYETAQMMSLNAYQVGGIVHVVANNQVGFTTSPKDARSSTYCTNVGRVTNSPIFHVNADDIESVHKIMTLAARYRAQFKKDIYVDLLCFRRLGHNENDEPSFTQPLLYKTIKEKSDPYEIYATQLISMNRFTKDVLQGIYKTFRDEMDAVHNKVKTSKHKIEQFKPQRQAGLLCGTSEKDILKFVDTKVSFEKLKTLAQALVEYPKEFHVHPKIERLIVNERKNIIDGAKAFDWGMTELLAYASLIAEGFSLRLIGEDTQRGTFSHRHAVLIDFENEKEFSALAHINSNTKVEIINSLLSEEAALGYEYGYSTVAVNTLSLWEAQFGDFVNGAQVLVDQFIASGETKWLQQSGLVLLLPHGMEGQGPEHSSARLERFLQLCANGNMQVCCVTKVTQLFHILRRQIKRNFRKPLVIMSPKSFLRSPRVTAALEDIAQSQFEEILDDPRHTHADSVTRILFCTGKIALDLFDALDTTEYLEISKTVAIVRIEQLYPLHIDKLSHVIARYANATIFAWVQEEPLNMGAYEYIRDEIEEMIKKCGKNQNLLYFGRSRRATPAVGFEKIHHKEQTKVIYASLKNRKSEFV